MKKILILVLSVVMIFGIVACAKDNPEGKQPAISITLNKYSIELLTGETFQLTGEVADSTEAIVWESADTTIASVSATGLVTGLSKGAVQVHAKVGEAKATCTVTVAEALYGVPRLEIGYKNINIYLGYSFTFEPLVYVGNTLVEIDKSQVVWTASNDNVSIEDGVIKGEAIGDVVISAEYTHNGVKLTRSVQFSVSSISILRFESEAIDMLTDNTVSGAATASGNELTLVLNEIQALGSNPLNVVVDNEDVIWESSDETIVTVADGVLSTNNKTGYATITAQYQGNTATCEVSVYTAISTAKDLDYLALARAKSPAAAPAEWSAQAMYMLTNDIDYSTYRSGALIPIAPIKELTSQAGARFVAGKQLKAILTADTTLGLNADDYSELNPDKDKFFGTIDGNGYSIKNAKLIMDAYVYTNTSAETNIRGTANFIGYLGAGAVIRNISFDNIKAQTFDEGGYTAGAVTLGGTALNVPVAEKFFALSGLFAYNYGNLENIYFDYSYAGMAGNALKRQYVLGELGSIYASVTAVGSIKNCIGIVRADAAMASSSAFGPSPAGSKITNSFFVDASGDKKNNAEANNASKSNWGLYESVAAFWTDVDSGNVTSVSAGEGGGVISADNFAAWDFGVTRTNLPKLIRKA